MHEACERRSRFSISSVTLQHEERATLCAHRVACSACGSHILLVFRFNLLPASTWLKSQAAASLTRSASCLLWRLPVHLIPCPVLLWRVCVRRGSVGSFQACAGIVDRCEALF